MAGISSKAAGIKQNEKEKFQGQEFASKEFSDGGGLDMYEFRYRTQDPQIGRFIQIDPLSHKYSNNSTYAFAENKVTLGIDLEGLELLPFNSSWFKFATETKNISGIQTSKERVDVIVGNVPNVFRDKTGAPLFSAGSVGVTPNGVVSGNGEQLREGNRLPPIPGWAWSSDAQPTQSTSGGFIGNNLENNQSYADKIGSISSAPQEAASWFSTFKNGGRVDTWNAYSELNVNVKSFGTAIGLVGKMPFGMTTNKTERSDLINFINDGAVPLIDLKNLRNSVQYGLKIMQTGIGILNNNSIDVRSSTNNTYEMYQKLLNAINSIQKK